MSTFEGRYARPLRVRDRHRDEALMSVWTLERVVAVVPPGRDAVLGVGVMPLKGRARKVVVGIERQEFRRFFDTAISAAQVDLRTRGHPHCCHFRIGCASLIDQFELQGPFDLDIISRFSRQGTIKTYKGVVRRLVEFLIKLASYWSNFNRRRIGVRRCARHEGSHKAN